MNIKELADIKIKYVRIILDGDLTRYENVNFTELLIFIGKHFPIVGRNEIGSAYKIIQERTDKLLHVNGWQNRKLRTTKYELKSIRLARFWLLADEGKRYCIRIPYKISFIFTAIIDIVSELAQSHPIPQSLEKCIDHAYGLSFYSRHIKQYNLKKSEFQAFAKSSDDRGLPAKLIDCFDASGSVFKQSFP